MKKIFTLTLFLIVVISVYFNKMYSSNNDFQGSIAPFTHPSSWILLSIPQQGELVEQVIEPEKLTIRKSKSAKDKKCRKKACGEKLG